MQIAAQTLENTYPTCNYVNCLWLFIQLFALAFAHAFICHIRGRRWCSESGRRSPQALWTDNGHWENPPLQSCAPSWPVHSTHHHMERDCFEEACMALHTSTQQGAKFTVHTHAQAHIHTPPWPHTQTLHERLLESHTHWAASLSDKHSFGFMFQTYSGNADGMTP